MYIFAETALASCLARLSNKPAICQPLLARLWACSSAAKCQIYGQSQDERNQGLWWEPPKADAKDPLPQTLYIRRSVLQVTEGCSQTPQGVRFSVCKRDTTGCFYVDLGTYNNQNWIFFVGSRAVSSCVCVDQNWIFLKWPGTHQYLWTPKPDILQGKVGPFPAVFVVTTT